MRRKLNKDQARRDELLEPYFGKEAQRRRKGPYLGGVASFEKLPLEVLEQLVEEGFVDLDDAQNESPTIRQFMRFARKYPKVIAFHGYAVEKARDDYRLSIEGVQFVGRAKDAKLAADWERLGKTADEKYARWLWWD